jgi:hypothetical protein
MSYLDVEGVIDILHWVLVRVLLQHSPGDFVGDYKHTHTQTEVSNGA